MKIYKLNRYIIGLFSISFLCINASQANEIGIGIIKLPNGPAQNYLLPKDEEKDALGGEDSEKKQIKIEWQITDNQINQDRPKVTSTILHGEKSYIYKGSEVFTDGKVPELVSFAGVYQLDNSKSAIAYKFERITAGTGYRWRLTYIDPFDTTTKEGQKRLLTNPFVLPAKNGEIRGQTNLTSEYSEVPILVRVAYKTDSPNTISKVYSTDVDDDNKATLDRWFKHYDQYFKDNKNLDKLVIDLGKANKINNATIKYCVFDINEDTKIIKPNLRYVSWTEFDQLEKPQDKNGDLITAKATPIFDTFVFKENEAFFSIDSMKTYFHFEKANVAKEAMMKLDSLKIPDIIRDLSSFKYAKKETWSVNGRVFGKELQENSHFALCYSFRSYLASSRAVYITSNDFKTVQSSISDGWKILDVLH